MTYELKKTYTEVYIVLKHMPLEYVNKIPKNVLDFIEKVKIEDYKIEIDQENPVDRTKLSKNAMTILAIFNFQYWCPNITVKNKLIENCMLNEKKREKEIKEKYSTDLVFKINSVQNENKKENMVVDFVEEDIAENTPEKMLTVICEENIVKKIINKIKKIILRFKNNK